MEKNEIIIDTSMDASGVEEGAKKVNKATQSTTEGYKALEDRMSKLIKKKEQLDEKLIKYEATGGQTQQLTNEYKAAEREVESLNKKLLSLYDRQEKMNNSGVNKNSSGYKNLQYDIEKVSRELDIAEKKKAELEENKYTNTRSFSAMNYDIEKVKQSIESTQQEMNKLEAQGKRFKPFGTPKYVDSYEKALSKTNRTAKKSSKIFAALTSRLRDHSKQQRMTMTRMLGMSLLFSTVFKALSAVTSGIKEGMTNLAKFNKGVNPVNSALSSLKSALTQLKNSFATAFAPILTVIAPILTKFINYLSDAITTLGMFFARLTGASSYTKAKKVNQQYAESARDAADAQEELNNKLADYDKLAVIDKDSNTGNSGSSGSNGDNSGVAFETVQLSDSAVKWADKFKEAWQNADFTDIGRTVGEKVKNALDNIDWGPIQTAAQKIGKSIGTFINGFVSVDGLGNKVGSTIAQALNTVMIGLDSFLTTTNWFNVGTFIGNIINGYVKDFNWSLLGKTVADALNAAMGTIAGFLNSVDWSQLGTSIVTTVSSFFATFDFSQLGRTACSLIVAGLNLIAGIVSGVNWSSLPGQIASKLKDCLTGIDWKSLLSAIGNLAGTILKAVWDWNTGLAKQIGDAGKKIVDYFKSKMDANALSKDSTLGQKGTAILKGILKGIIDGMASIGSWIVTNIVKPFATAMGKTGFGDVARNLWNGLKKAVEAVLKPFSIKIKIPTWSDIKAKVKKTINDMIGFLNNTIIKKLNNMLTITAPKNIANDVLGISGKKYTLATIPTIKPLAAGGVIPPNHEFLAMLGDQKSGVNIETPLATMIEAFDKALDKRGGANSSMPEKVVLSISDGRTIAELVWDEEEKKYKQTGTYRPSYV